MGLLSWLTGRGGGARPTGRTSPARSTRRTRTRSTPACGPRSRSTASPCPAARTAWLVTRYDDVVAVLKDERFAKDKFNALTPEQAARQPWVPAMFRPLTRNMLDLDPPDHTRLRALVQKAFTPRLVEQMRPAHRGAGRRPARRPSAAGGGST